MKTLDTCPTPRLILSFDFDGTLHDPAQTPPVPLGFFPVIRHLRENHGAVWGINTGRSMPQMIEGFIESRFPFIPDWVVAREREIYFPNAFGRWLPHKEWNDTCEKAIHKLFKRSKKVLKEVRREISEHTGAQWIEMDGEPAGIISRTEEEMEWIVGHISPIVAAMPDLGWQRNSIYLRFGHLKYQKGSSLAELGRLYEIGVEARFAMGDSHNDLEMLSPEYSGLAACPENAVPAVREKIIERGGVIATRAHGDGVVEALGRVFG